VFIDLYVLWKRSLCPLSSHHVTKSGRCGYALDRQPTTIGGFLESGQVAKWMLLMTGGKREEGDDGRSSP
jgi:hypothetical protein